MNLAPRNRQVQTISAHASNGQKLTFLLLLQTWNNYRAYTASAQQFLLKASVQGGSSKVKWIF